MPNPLTSKMIVMFGSPSHSANPVEFVAEIDRLTSGFGPEALERAASALLRTHVPSNAKPWPSPAEICKACADAQEALAPPRTEEAYPDWSKEALREAYRLIKSPLGEDAARGGWILSLWDFCRKQRRLPQRHEIPILKQNAEDFNEAYGEANRWDGGTLSRALVKLGDSMLARRQALAEYVLEGRPMVEDWNDPSRALWSKR